MIYRTISLPLYESLFTLVNVQVTSELDKTCLRKSMEILMYSRGTQTLKNL